jgi:putative transposase
MCAEKAYGNYLNSLSGKRKGKKMGLPRFKSKKSHDFSYKECMVSQKALNRGDSTVKIPKLGEVKYRNKRIGDFYTAPGATLRSITVRKNPAGDYYAVLLFERPYTRQTKVFSDNREKTIGLDFSPADLYVDSNGKIGKDFGYTAQKQAHKKPLKKFQRRLARKQKGSANREKARVKVDRLENHIANSRLDFIEKETLRLVRTYEVIGIEDLNLIGISKFLANAKNMTDTSWATFVSKLQWKASKNEHNCQVMKVDRYFPSSQLCSHCGNQKRDLKLSDRVWKCPTCGTEHVRDHNAAVNLREEAIRILVASQKFTFVESHSESGERIAALTLTA